MAVHKSWKLNTSGIQWKPTSQALSKIDRRCSSLETDTNPDEREKKKEEEEVSKVGMNAQDDII
jgi:hypothetical protein